MINVRAKLAHRYVLNKEVSNLEILLKQLICFRISDLVRDEVWTPVWASVDRQVRESKLVESEVQR